MIEGLVKREADLLNEFIPLSSREFDNNTRAGHSISVKLGHSKAWLRRRDLQHQLFAADRTYVPSRVQNML